MRPAIEAGLMVLLEAAGPYIRPVLAVTKVTFRLSKSWSRAPIIGKPAHEKETFSAYSAFSAIFFRQTIPCEILQTKSAPSRRAVLQCRVLGRSTRRRLHFDTPSRHVRSRRS
jgi:hypothetical protein